MQVACKKMIIIEKIAGGRVGQTKMAQGKFAYNLQKTESMRSDADLPDVLAWAGSVTAEACNV